MKTKPILFLIPVLVLSFFISSGNSQTQTYPNIPTSPRAQEVIKRQKPILEKKLNELGLSYGSPIFIRAFKSSKKLELWIKGDSTFKLFKTYDICYYSGNMGPKLKQGDLQSPEGFYFVKPKQLNPNSRFHLSFNIGYPNEFDRFHKRTGSAIMIHGSCVSIGCYAMTDSKIEEIYTLADAAFRNGQPFFQVHIFPFTMTDLNVKNHRFFKWYEFWKNLKPGFDYFEKYHLVPDVLVKNGKYHFQ